MIIYLDDSLCNVFKLIIKFQKEKGFNPLKRSSCEDRVHLANAPFQSLVTNSIQSLVTNDETTLNINSRNYIIDYVYVALKKK